MIMSMLKTVDFGFIVRLEREYAAVVCFHRLRLLLHCPQFVSLIHWILAPLLRLFGSARERTAKTFMQDETVTPNKPIETTRVGHRSSASRFTVMGRGCLIFFR